MFLQDCFPHGLQGACKADILDYKYDDDERTIVVCFVTIQNNLVTCVTWTKKSPICSRALTKSQNHVGFKPRKMLKPIKAQW